MRAIDRFFGRKKESLCRRLEGRQSGAWARECWRTRPGHSGKGGRTSPARLFLVQAVRVAVQVTETEKPSDFSTWSKRSRRSTYYSKITGGNHACASHGSHVTTMLPRAYTLYSHVDYEIWLDHLDYLDQA
jgi:hypothetical protein